MDKAQRMSEPAADHVPGGGDKPAARSRETRQALLASFARLVLSRRYRDFGVDAVVRGAKVARSTFYYHFAGKDDLLLENLKPFVQALASAPRDHAASPELGWWTAHIWQHRGTAARLLVGRTGDKMQSALTAELRAMLRAAIGTSAGAADPAMRAEQIAGSTMALLRGWIAHRFSASPNEVAAAIWQSARALSPLAG